MPLELGRPVWVDDPHFNLAYHVWATALPEPADDSAVSRLMGRLMSQELDRNRPLWECWSCTACRRRWGLLSKVHHCMVDGIAGVGLLEALLDLDADASWRTRSRGRRHRSRREPSMVLDAWAGLLGDVGHGRDVPTSGTRGTTVRAARPGRMVRSVGTAITPTNSPRDPSVRIGSGPTPPRRSRRPRIRRSHGGTLNDVVLAAVTRGYRDLLLSRARTLRVVLPHPRARLGAIRGRRRRAATTGSPRSSTSSR